MSRPEEVAAIGMITAFVDRLDAQSTSASERWRIRLHSAGLPLEVELLIRRPLLRAEAAVLPAGLISPDRLLRWNRQAPLVAFGTDDVGGVWLSGELPLAGLENEMLDRFLGLLLASASRAREYVLTGQATR